MRQLRSLIVDAHFRLAGVGAVDWVKWALYPQMRRATPGFPADLPFSLSWSSPSSDTPTLRCKFTMQGELYVAGGTFSRPYNSSIAAGLVPGKVGGGKKKKKKKKKRKKGEGRVVA